MPKGCLVYPFIRLQTLSHLYFFHFTCIFCFKVSIKICIPLFSKNNSSISFKLSCWKTLIASFLFNCITYFCNNLLINWINISNFSNILSNIKTTKLNSILRPITYLGHTLLAFFEFFGCFLYAVLRLLQILPLFLLRCSGVFAIVFHLYNNCTI